MSRPQGRLFQYSHRCETVQIKSWILSILISFSFIFAPKPHAFRSLLEHGGRGVGVPRSLGFVK